MEVMKTLPEMYDELATKNEQLQADVRRLSEGNRVMANMLTKARVRQTALRNALSHVLDNLCWNGTHWYLKPTFTISTIEQAMRVSAPWSKTEPTAQNTHTPNSTNTTSS